MGNTDFGLGKNVQDDAARQRLRLQAYAGMLGAGRGPFIDAQLQRQQLGGTYMLDQLRNPQILGGSSQTLPALIELSAYGRTLQQEYAHLDLPVPEWLIDNLCLLREEIQQRHRAERQVRLRQLEQEIEALRSREEQKQAKEWELADLREELGL